MLFNSLIKRPMYNCGKLYYMDISLTQDIKERVEKVQDKIITNDILKVKIPYRYNRVDCKVVGIIPVEDMKEGDEIFNSIQYCGKWGGGTFWKFDMIQKITDN